ncbi:hypothetical protein [Fusobacterium massiliense]|uniref:hypothetical protein n=1 Tax=Fusobacterium massiliense TaxID=1852365 RepID=UPI0028D81C1A|nr:hypothetical protein [Fusobacterium massiliense]
MLTQETIKILGVEVQMPYHNETYMVGEEPEGHIPGIVKNAGIVEEIRLAEEDYENEERDIIYIKMEKNGIILELYTNQPGLRIIWEEE